VTYCLALRLDEGLVFLADTRTNAGVDNVSTYRKLHLLQPTPDRLFVIEAAGSLATTQEVLDRVKRDLGNDSAESLATVDHLFEAALYLGRLSREVSSAHHEALAESGADGTATFILGGQVASEEPDILLVYPEGNYIRASDDRPFLQIGESKYGKFMLDLAIEAKVDIDVATSIAMGSMMSTTESNLSVGPPYDGCVYLNGSFDPIEFRIESDSPLLEKLRGAWQDQMHAAIEEVRRISEEDPTITIPDLGGGSRA
jgi:putative proteasome-type protease